MIAKSSSPVTDLITSNASPQVQTGHTNVPLLFTSTITNRGSVTAIGCHFHSALYSDLKTNFYEVNPANGQRLAADNVPRNIAAGQSRTFKVLVASQSARDADFIDPEVVADCANNSRNQFNLRRGFDVSTSAIAERLPSLSVTSSVPANGVLTVPGSGFAYYKFRAKNTQTTRSLDVLPAYVGPFDDPANSNYTVAICRTNLSNGKCIGSYASSVIYNAVKGTVFGFSVRVKAPQVATPLDPDKRRVYVNFKRTECTHTSTSPRRASRCASSEVAGCEARPLELKPSRLQSPLSSRCRVTPAGVTVYSRVAFAKLGCGAIQLRLVWGLRCGRKVVPLFLRFCSLPQLRRLDTRVPVRAG